MSETSSISNTHLCLTISKSLMSKPVKEIILRHDTYGIAYEVNDGKYITLMEEK